MIIKGTKCFWGLLVVALLLSFSGCTFNDNEITLHTDGDDALVTFSIQLPGVKFPKTRALNATDENEVAEIDVLVFEPSGKYVYSARCNGSDISTDSQNGRKKTFTVKLRQGNFDLAIVANARSILTGANLKGMTKSDALSALKVQIPTGDKWIAQKGNAGYKPFPMWGDIGEKTIDESTDLTGANAISLTRMVAKIDVKVDNDAVDNFTLTSVHVFNYNTQGTVVPESTAWDGGKATAPTVPSTSTLTEGPLNYDNTVTTEINTSKNSCENEIYLFESENHTSTGHTTGKDLLKRTCIVVGGLYGTDSSNPTYYRVDFSNGSGVSQTFLDVLRNYQYIFNITKVSGPGYDTPEIAFKSGPVNIEANVIQWNQADMTDVVWDGQYMLSVNRNEFYLPSYEQQTEDEEGKNVLYVMTDYPLGWTVDKMVDAADENASVNWLELSETSGTAYNTAEVTLKVKKNSTTTGRSAVIWLKAGRLRYAVTVNQAAYHLRWARSNIVFIPGNNPNNPTEEGRLTFAITAKDNAKIPANSQGVFFKFGSLVAISPAPLPNTTSTDYKAGPYPSGHILSDPTGGYNYASWTDIPCISETTGKFGTHLTSEDDFKDYGENGFGFDITAGKGDICRYISAQRWVSGSWRLPTADEIKKLIKGGSVPNCFSTSAVTVPNGDANAYGYYTINYGSWLGEGASTSSGIASPSSGMFLPAVGCRSSDFGVAGYTGINGCYWSGSTRTRDNAYFMFVDAINTAGCNYSYRQFGLPVRCVND